jgi:ribA/ribD-fused uncharacterized protein
MKIYERINATHLFFYGGIFSQWYTQAPFYDQELNLRFSSGEQYMMYRKALLFKDRDAMAKIMSTTSPKEVKDLGRDVSGFKQDIWDAHKLDIIVRANFLKFSQNEALLNKMRKYAHLKLVEASPVDTIYGIGLKSTDSRVLDESKWRGENLLGVALMRARDLILNQNISPHIVMRNASIINASENIIAHGCNTQGASGAGIAKYMALKFPLSDREYKKRCRNGDFILGDILFYRENSKIIANCATQEYYGRRLKMDKDSVENRYQAIRQCLTRIYVNAKREQMSVAIPKLGCGRARLDWSRVLNIIKEVFHDYPITIYYIEDKYC